MNTRESEPLSVVLTITRGCKKMGLPPKLENGGSDHESCRKICTGLIPLFHGLNIPRKSRYSPKKLLEQPKQETPADETTDTPLISEFEVATILIQLSLSHSHFQPGVSSNPNKRKRVDPPLKTKTKKKKVHIETQKKTKDLILVPNDMPDAMKNKIREMGGYGINLVIQKKLEDSDINKNYGRLSLSQKKLRSKFLTYEEKKRLNGHDESNKVKGMQVLILDPLLRDKTICLKQWKIGSSPVYCLMTQWNSLVRDNLLEAGDYIQLWSFRVDQVDAVTGELNSRLCLAMVKLEVVVD